MKIIQLMPTMSYGDAVSNDALAICRLLAESGISSSIYAENVDPRLKEKSVFLLKDLPELKKEDLMIYHLSTGTDLNFRVGEFRCRKVMVYHNVTPPAYFALYNRGLEELCTEGLRGMVHLRKTFQTVIADSEFNRQNLLDAGYECPVQVAPILIPFDDYAQEPDGETIRKYSDGRTNTLFVGRIAPNKKQEDVIRAFDCYRRNYNPEARLILIGSSFGTENYLEKLKRYAKMLGAEENVVFPGHISFRQILAFYRTANAFLCMSEHEGFCVPVAEAMYFRVPVIARSMCAVPETVGEAGILLEDARPEPAAAALNRVITDGALRERMAAAAEKRLKELSYESVSGRIRELLLPLVRGAEGVKA